MLSYRQFKSGPFMIIHNFSHRIALMGYGNLSIITQLPLNFQPGYCKVPVIDNGKLNPEWPTIRSGAELEVTCNPYFSLSDESISKVTCTDGVLSELPTCELSKLNNQVSYLFALGQDKFLFYFV